MHKLLCILLLLVISSTIEVTLAVTCPSLCTCTDNDDVTCEGVEIIPTGRLGSYQLYIRSLGVGNIYKIISLFEKCKSSKSAHTPRLRTTALHEYRTGLNISIPILPGTDTSATKQK